MKSMVFVIALCGAFACAAVAQAGEEEYTIEDVAFLAGHWIGSEEIGRPEEGWFAPYNGVMTGLFRWPSAEGRYVVELLIIAEEEDGVFYRFKHFDPDMTAWEKDEPISYRLSDVTDGCATFDGVIVPSGTPANIQYCRTDEGLVFRGGAAGEPIGEAKFTLDFKPY